MSAAQAKPVPPPMHQPRTADTTGARKVSIRSTRKRPSSRKARPSSAEWRASSPRSAPAEKARLPAPVMTTQRVSARSSSWSKAARSSSSISKEKRLKGGRLKVIVETPSSCQRDGFAHCGASLAKGAQADEPVEQEDENEGEPDQNRRNRG